MLALLLLAACSSPPVLISKSAAVPVGVDLSGFWHLIDGGPSRRMENAEGIGEKGLGIAADICIYTNHNLVLEEQDTVD